MQTASVLRVVTVLQAVAIGGCSLLVETDRQQCVVDSDCTARGEAFTDSVCIDSWCTAEPKWSCLGAPQSKPASLHSFPVTLHLQDIQTQQPLAGVQARLCRKSDPKCVQPETETVMSDALGVVRFALGVEEDKPRRFAGFVKLVRDDLVPALYNFNPPVEHEVDIAPVQLLSRSGSEALARQLGATFDAGRGSVLLSVFDCTGDPAGGVTIATDDSDERAARFYSVAGLPLTKATATDTSGYAGLVNVAPSTIAITGRIASNQRSLGTISLPVQAGAITYSRMAPGDE